ncbi:GT4 family glycosyltransferase PelF [Acetivibrio clariflavus]|uniref:Glycosyltransferase n=1 Tax=Acetivibrio clariflavus (strain DSM 19732 / NBRC 101661 / EBR45) TaxID=720554 RepID=G8M379_ACECE|nr:GT4 family glycosyltransferase PelF [Acetivibrio clariflavus]AEV70399.1 glycosyltransferase [Acetivibrio clariflavus DSM 19732]HOQ01707.1 GT4 family glycosyltransferase PelF [Acetivibrio clariflavus]HPU40837.1 GT4 family glycosyltransferase PelF [Acetivibrio clariflavus]
MNLCFIAEGSYPYMTGGISSWMNIYMKCFPDYKLSLYTIAARESDKGKFVCKIPENMIHIEEVFLDTPLKKKPKRFPSRIVKSSKQQELLIKHFSGEKVDWAQVFDFVDKLKKYRLIDFFNSADFYEIVDYIYNKDFQNAPYNDFLWSIRTMFIYEFHVLQGHVPEADIYHSVSAGFPGIVGSKIRYNSKKPFILTEHGIYVREREEEILKSDFILGYIKELWIKYFRSMSLCAYNFADKIVSQFQRNREVQIEFGADREKTVIIPNGMNTEDYNFPEQDRIYGDDFVVGTIARIVPIKDIITLVRAFEKAQQLYDDKMRLVIVGPNDEDPQYSRYVLDYVEKRNIQNITFTGKVDYETYLKSLYSFDVFILTSISEGQPLSLLEAMASGKPAIVTDVGSCSEIVLGTFDNIGEAGIVARVMDSDALGEAIVKLAKNKDLRMKMGQAARKRVQQYYTIDYMGSSYRKLYEDLKR